MQSHLHHHRSSSGAPGALCDATMLHEPCWFVVQTSSRHEKKVHAGLSERGIESFLPSYCEIHRWRDRKQRVELPLFPGYVFVRLALAEKLAVLCQPGVARLVSVGGVPAPVSESEINSLREGLAHSIKAEPYPFLRTGEQVRVKCGPLAGLTGILVRKKQDYRVVISIELIMRSVALEVGADEVEPLRVIPSAMHHAPQAKAARAAAFGGLF